MKQDVKVQLRLPQNLHKWIVKWASENNRSMNKQIVTALEERMQMQLKTEPLPAKNLGG